MGRDHPGRVRCRLVQAAVLELLATAAEGAMRPIFGAGLSRRTWLEAAPGPAPRSFDTSTIHPFLSLPRVPPRPSRPSRGGCGKQHSRVVLSIPLPFYSGCEEALEIAAEHPYAAYFVENTCVELLRRSPEYREKPMNFYRLSRTDDHHSTFPVERLQSEKVLCRSHLSRERQGHKGCLHIARPRPKLPEIRSNSHYHSQSSPQWPRAPRRPASQPMIPGAHPRAEASLGGSSLGCVGSLCGSI